MKLYANILLLLIMAGITAFAGHTIVSGRHEAHFVSVPDSMEAVPDPVSIRLVFAGDLMQHMPQVNAARRDGGFDYSDTFEFVRPHFDSADLVLVNLETTLTSSGCYTGYPLFRSPVGLAHAMADAGIDVALLANNHCCDGGAEGVRTTIDELNAAGVGHTGLFADSTDYAANNPLYIDCRGVRLAIVNYTYSTNGMPVPERSLVNRIDTVAIARDLAAVDRSSVDCVIAVMHWGEEYQRSENRTQRYLADFLKRHGTDVIIGSHPHVIQPVVGDSAGLTVYSLGNFVSNQQKRYTDGGLVVTVCVEKRPFARPLYSVSVMPVWVLCPGYRIITPEVGDTMLMSEWSRERYDRFMADTRKHLSQ